MRSSMFSLSRGELQAEHSLQLSFHFEQGDHGQVAEVFAQFACVDAVEVVHDDVSGAGVAADEAHPSGEVVSLSGDGDAYGEEAVLHAGDGLHGEGEAVQAAVFGVFHAVDVAALGDDVHFWTLSGAGVARGLSACCGKQAV